MIKYIFSINTGRSGSHYLSSMLSEFEEVSSNHEPEPIMNGLVMRKFLNGDQDQMNIEMHEKIDNIKNKLSGNNCYFETNHCFIKGFGWLIPNYFPHEEIGVILLKRDKKKILNSTFRINCTPLTKDGRDWIMNPLMKNPINKVPLIDKIKYMLYYNLYKFIKNPLNPLNIQNLKNINYVSYLQSKVNQEDKSIENNIKSKPKSKIYFLSKIQKLIKSKYNPLNFGNYTKPNFIKDFEMKYIEWYIDETYAQGKKYLKMYPGIKVYETTIEKLNDVEEFERIFNFFKIPFKPKDSFFDKLNKKTNLKSNIS